MHHIKVHIKYSKNFLSWDFRTSIKSFGRNGNRYYWLDRCTPSRCLLSCHEQQVTLSELHWSENRWYFDEIGCRWQHIRICCTYFGYFFRKNWHIAFSWSDCFHSVNTFLSRYFKKLFVSDLQWTTFRYSFTVFSFIGTANQWVQQSRFWYFEHSLLSLVLFSPTQTKCGEPTGFEKMILPVIYRSKSSPFDMFLALQNHRDTIFLSSFFGAFLKRYTRVSRSGDYILAFESVMPIYVADSIE